jgi:hypothetical protein
MDACETVAKITRTMQIDQGHVLILGTGGKGRCCLARLACYLAEFKLFEGGINQDYTLRLWCDDLKKVLLTSGIDNTPVGFILSDKRIFSDKIYEDLNKVLTSGEINHIYTEKDQEEIV